jgi:hypothetical protein
MTDPQELQRLLDAACRFGDVQADQIVAQANELRTLRRVMWHALAQLRAGRPDAARRTLLEALKT